MRPNTVDDNPINLREEFQKLKTRLKSMNNRLGHVERSLAKQCSQTSRIEKNVWVHNGMIGIALLLLIRLLGI